MTEQAPESYFHTHEGFCFRRTGGGDVQLFLYAGKGDEEHIAYFNAAEWASVVAFVSKRPYGEAFELHQGWWPRGEGSEIQGANPLP